MCRTKGVLCSRAPKKRVEPRGDCSRATYSPQGRLYGVLCSKGGLLGGSPTWANFEFINKEYIFIGTIYFRKAQSKTTRDYAGQYVEIHDLSRMIGI